MQSLPWWYWAVNGALIMGVLASFAGVVAERVPEGRSLNGRSRCACGQPVLARDNVPVAGWLIRRGRARCCGAALSARYVLSEVAAASLGILAGALAGAGGIAVAILALAVVTGAVTIARRKARSGRDGS